MRHSSEERLIADMVVTMDEQDNVYAPGLVAWSRGRITEVRAAEPDDTVELHVPGVVLPGFINTHHHLASTVLTGLESPSSINVGGHGSSRALRLAAVMDEEFARDAARLAYRQLIRAGITTTTDSHAAWRTDRRVDGSLEAARMSGLRVLATVAFLDRTELIPAKARFGVDDAINELTRLRNLFSGPRLEVEGEPLSLPRCSDALIRALHGERRRYTAMHLTYSRAFEQWARHTLGRPAVVHLAELGVLDSGWVFAHPIHLQDHEIRLLAECGAGTSYCPVSNLQMGLESPDLRRLRRHGIAVGIGIDHPNGQQDLLAEAKAATIVQRSVAADAHSWGATTALRMLTVDGARALGMQDDLGRLTPGFAADLSMFTDLPLVSTRLDEVAELLVMGGGRHRATHVLADGQWLLRDEQLTAATTQNDLAEAIQLRRRIVAAAEHQGT